MSGGADGSGQAATKARGWKETRLISRCRSKPRRGRQIDRAYLAWMAEQVCLVTGRWPVTLHHVRRMGEPKQDRRVIPLIAELHLIQFGAQSIEALGKRKFQALHKVDIEGAILRYNEMYKQALVNGSSGGGGK